MHPVPFKDEYHRHTSITVEQNIPVPMRDGIRLYADVYRPSGGGRHPVLLQRLPYGKHKPRYRSFYLEPLRAVNRGYVVVLQDVRGRHASEGVFYPYRHEADDGYDTVAWCASQPWCDGNVGMFGISYHGATQWLAATAAPPALKAIVPGVTADTYYDSWTYLGGVFQSFWITDWAASFVLDDIGRKPEDQPEAIAALRQWRRDPYAMAQHLPLKEMPALRGLADYYYDWLDHPTYDAYWKALSPRERFDRVTIPALHIGGWFDGFMRGTVRCYEGMRARGATDVARQQQHLLVGPWLHGPLPPGQAGQGYFGGGAAAEAIDLHGMHLAWFDHWLRGENNGIDTQPTTHIFVMGANTWRSEEAWPPPSAQPVAYFLRSEGRANTLNGDGRLSLDPPGAAEPADHFLYNPLSPVPTCGGAHLHGIPGVFATGVQEQRAIQARQDVLVYTSAPLRQDTEVTGHVRVRLWAATSAPDTDWTAMLVDVHPDGRAYNVCDGILRARYRESLEEPSAIEPGAAYPYTLDLGPTSMLFRRGHCLRLTVSSSNFPAYARNLNTGGFHADEVAPRPATQTILHDADHPSVLTLPIVAAR
jgi:putative CocE/NonD family hydrolase